MEIGFDASPELMKNRRSLVTSPELMKSFAAFRDYFIKFLKVGGVPRPFQN